MMVITLSSALSPLVTDRLAYLITGVSLLDSFDTLQISTSGGSMGQAIAWSVMPLSAAAYIFQLLALRYFNSDTLSYKGHGAWTAEGQYFGSDVMTKRISVKEMNRKRRRAKLMNNESFDVLKVNSIFRVFTNKPSLCNPSSPKFEPPKAPEVNPSMEFTSELDFATFGQSEMTGITDPLPSVQEEEKRGGGKAQSSKLEVESFSDHAVPVESPTRRRLRDIVDERSCSKRL